jgi:hypothetical protein
MNFDLESTSWVLIK